MPSLSLSVAAARFLLLSSIFHHFLERKKLFYLYDTDNTATLSTKLAQFWLVDGLIALALIRHL